MPQRVRRRGIGVIFTCLFTWHGRPARERRCSVGSTPLRRDAALRALAGRSPKIVAANETQIPTAAIALSNPSTDPGDKPNRREQRGNGNSVPVRHRRDLPVQTLMPSVPQLRKLVGGNIGAAISDVCSLLAPGPHRARRFNLHQVDTHVVQLIRERSIWAWNRFVRPFVIVRPMCSHRLHERKMCGNHSIRVFQGIEQRRDQFFTRRHSQFAILFNERTARIRKNFCLARLARRGDPIQHDVFILLSRCGRVAWIVMPENAPCDLIVLYL